ncbi:hypothetical protein N836_24175 [Leptolyngbya sp. Heron Island J]|uniref:hypothetical protein n=1 Tax=Leptolyngbya sp. Heron Island J TaxID=1385935 RepID=UPI0003B97892|nr:hypothetical protein [Leptolyngbya sp. Heron Island J]ESA32888.1 hypothetical protein N836_24175 [Leptolyngbya sp. Heron Island J]
MAEDTSNGQAARVKRTGIALVHEGELVLPAAGSEAQAEQVMEDARAVIHYHFPVEIEVRAAPEPIDPEAIINETLRRLSNACSS